MLLGVLDRELYEVIARWDAAPEAIKAGILGMLRATTPNPSTTTPGTSNTTPEA